MASSSLDIGILCAYTLRYSHTILVQSELNGCTTHRKCTWWNVLVIHIRLMVDYLSLKCVHSLPSKKILPIIIALFPFYLDFVSWNTLMHSNVYLQRCLREQSTQSRQLISGCYCLLLFVSQNRCHLVNYQDIFFEHKVWSKVRRIINVSITPESHYWLLSTLKNNTFYMMILPEMLFYMVMHTTL